MRERGVQGWLCSIHNRDETIHDKKRWLATPRHGRCVWSHEKLHRRKIAPQHISVGLSTLPQPPCILPSSQQRERERRGGNTNKKGGRWRWSEDEQTVKYDLWTLLLLRFFHSPCFPVVGVNNADSSEGMCVQPFFHSAYLSHAHKHSGKKRALLCLHLTPPCFLVFHPEIYLCWLLKRPSGCHLDRVDGPNCI